MIIHSMTRAAEGILPYGRPQAGKFSLNFPEIGKSLNRIAIPVIAILAIASLPGADAGPASYGTCVAMCMSLATPVFLPACLAGCVGLTGPWCP